MGCGKILDTEGGCFKRICGGFWYGEIVKCDECEEKETNKRILAKQEALLDKQLRNK